ncbi:MAG: hypothetical protein ACKO2P_03650 [Planctomycetota bacterium]
MSRRPHIAPDDSLELLLDTICNTFATVIFISMLASLLAQNSAPEAMDAAEVAAAQKAVAQLELEAEQLAERRAALERELAQQSALLDRFASSETLQLASSLQELLTDHTQLLAESNAAAAALLQSEQQQLQLEQTLARQQDELQQQEQQQATLASQLSELETREGREAVIRRVHETDKFALTYALDNGRLYSVHTLSGPGTEFTDVTINRTDCLVVERGQRTEITMNPTAGVAIRDNADARQQARERFRNVGSRFVVRLFVARDSFPEFHEIKEALRELQLEYSLQIATGDDVELYLSEKIQDRTFVQ